MDENELIQKFNINIEDLKREQVKLSKNLQLKDSTDFSLATRFGAVESICVRNRIISVIIVCDKEFEVIEQQYFFGKLDFPYLQGFRAYREMPSMIEAYNKLNEKPDVIFVHGHGILHPRLGLASHLSLALGGIPTIGVAGELLEENKIAKNGSDVLLGEKIAGRILQSKEKANPLFVSPGNNISIESAYNLTKSLLKQPHKLPEPMHLAHKYAKDVQKELKLF